MAKRTRNPKREAIRRLIAIRNVLAREWNRIDPQSDPDQWDVEFTSKVAIVVWAGTVVKAGEYAEVAEFVAQNLEMKSVAIKRELLIAAGCK